MFGKQRSDRLEDACEGHEVLVEQAAPLHEVQAGRQTRQPAETYRSIHFIVVSLLLPSLQPSHKTHNTRFYCIALSTRTVPHHYSMNSMFCVQIHAFVFTHLDTLSVSVHSLCLSLPTGFVTVAVITTATRLFTHSCWCACVIVRPGGVRKLEYDWVPRCEEQESHAVLCS